MRITYLVRGVERKFRRYGDHDEKITLFRCWVSGGLLYGYKDRYNVVSIPVEDIKGVII